jgi:molybdopterin molybdotransferase
LISNVQMISVEEALEKILGYIAVLEPEEKHVLECLGQVAAEDIRSSIDVPPLDNAGMDGYAVRAESIAGAGEKNPQQLKVIGDVPAGTVSKEKVGRGESMSIMTGAAVPEGADTVVPFEDTDGLDRRLSGASLSEVNVRRAWPRGKNIRLAGEDIRRGDLLVSKGAVLRPQEIGVLASIGRARLKVIRRPMVAILATGDELVDIDKPLPFGKIHNSNTYTLATQVQRYGGIPRIMGIAPDDMRELSLRIQEGLDSDMLITSGGVSQGYYDVVKEVLAREGEVAFWTVRMKPGKPLAFGVFRGGKAAGRKGGVPHLGVPGNPVSSMIVFELFARPAILKMLGKQNFVKPTIRAVMEDGIKNEDGRRIFARVIAARRDGGYFAHTTGGQGSGILTSMVKANGLAIVPEEMVEVKPGDSLNVMMLDWGEE